MVDDRWPACTVPFVLVVPTNVATLRAAGYTPSKAPDLDDCVFPAERAAAVTAFLLTQSAAIARATGQLGCHFELVDGDLATYLASESPLLVLEHIANTCHVRHVGYSADPNYPNSMSLGWCWDQEDAIVHEMAHVLGLHHEHSNPNSVVTSTAAT
jgi:hypothetical protein